MNIRRLTLFLMLAFLCIAGAEEASAFYNPGTGRWLSRDPLQENGGVNLNAFVENDPVNSYDPLGLKAQLSYDNLIGPKPGTCGRFLWKIVWKPSGDSNFGVISQEVTIKGHYRRNCDDKDTKYNAHTWEYWSVPGANKDSVDPVFWGTPCGNGEINYTLTAQYYDGQTVPSNSTPTIPGVSYPAGPPFFGPGENPPDATGPKKPNFPKNASKSNVVTRKFTLKWDCCKTPGMLTEIQNLTQ